MFDTIAIRKQVPSEIVSVLPPGWRRMQDNFNTKVDRFINMSRTSGEPRTTLAMSPGGIWYCRSEVSPGRWLRGSNFPLSDEEETKYAVKELSDFVSRRINFDFDASDGIVCRVDFAKDYQVGQKGVAAAIRKIGQIEMSHYTRDVIEGTTVNFRTRGKKSSRKYCVYDKWTEVRSKGGSDTVLAAAMGILRVENSYLTTPAIKQLQKRLMLPNCQPNSILTSSTAKLVVDETARNLSLDMILLQNKANNMDRIETLIAEYGSAKAMSHLGFLAVFEAYGPKFYRFPWLNITQRVYAEKLTSCKNAGVLPYE